MWPLHPGFDNNVAFKSMFTLGMIGFLDVSEKQWLRSLVKGSIEATHFWQVSVFVCKFHFKGGICLPIRYVL